MDRKLERARQDPALLEEQGKVEDFLNNVRNTDKLGSMLEDIRDAIIEYQVRVSFNQLSLPLSLMPNPDFVAARYL